MNLLSAGEGAQPALMLTLFASLESKPPSCDSLHPCDTAALEAQLRELVPSPASASDTSCLGTLLSCFLVFFTPAEADEDSLLLAPSCTAQQQGGPCSFQRQHGGLGSRFGLTLEQQKQGNSLTRPFFSWEPCPLKPGSWFAGLKGFP